MTDISERIKELGGWYQRIQLDDGPLIRGHGGCGDPAWPYIEELLQPKGKRILDLGSNAGIHAIRACQAGAKEVVCIEVQDEHLEQAKFVQDYFEEREGKLPIVRIKAYVEDIPKLNLGYFDSVLALSILYHIGKLKNIEGRGILGQRLDVIRMICSLTDHVIVRTRNEKHAHIDQGFFRMEQFRLAEKHERSRIFTVFERVWKPEWADPEARKIWIHRHGLRQ